MMSGNCTSKKELCQLCVRRLDIYRILESFFIIPHTLSAPSFLFPWKRLFHQLTKELSMEEIENSGLGPYYIDHTVGIWPQAAGGVPFNACEFQSKGDPITDLFEDLAAEQKARSTYDNILRVVKNIPEVADPIRFLRAREVVHFQRFGEALRSVQEQLDAKKQIQSYTAAGSLPAVQLFLFQI